MNQNTFLNSKCDWSINGTIAYIESELRPFKFQGCGWYFTKGVNQVSDVLNKDTLLILPYYDLPNKDGSEPTEPRYVCLVWNHHEATQALNEMVNAPVLVDER